MACEETSLIEITEEGKGKKTRDKTRDRREEIRAERKKRLQRDLEKKRCATCKAKLETNQKDVECVKCYQWIRMEIFVKKLEEIEHKKENKEEGKKREKEIKKAMSALDEAIKKLKKSR